MKVAGRVLLAAVPLLACGGSPAEPTGGSSEGVGESSSTGGGEPTTGGTSGGETSIGETSSGEDSSAGGSTGGESSSTGESSSSTGGSSGEESSTGEPIGPAPDFGLIDVNPSSASFEQPVSPRDYLERVSGWYFAHAT